MKSTVEALDGNKVKLSVEVDENEFDKAVDAAVRKIAREVRLPGFRPGKAPRRLLEARLGPESVRQEALREALPEYYARALRENEVDAIAPPEIDITGGEQGGPLAFDAVVEVRPQVSIAGYQGLRVTVPAPSVGDEEIDRQVDRLRASFGELQPVERPIQDGDHVTIDVAGSQGGEQVEALSADDYLYEVGSAGIVPEVDEQLRGAKVGDILRFDSQLGDDTLSFRVLVKDVKEMVLPEVTDEWASEASEFETVDELRSDIRKRMEMVKKVQASLAIRDEAVKALAELVTEDVPDPLVGQETERRLHDLAHRIEAQGATIQQYLEATQQDQQAFVEGLREAAAEAVKADLALRALAEAEAIEATDEDVDNEIERLAQQLEQRPEQIRRQLEQSEQEPAVRSDIRKAKALAWLIEHVEVVDEEGNPIDRAALEPTSQDEDGPADQAGGTEEEA
jgi:trigger factor